jgi:hypothetical protein
MQATLPRKLQASALVLGSLVSAAALGLIGGLGSVSLMGEFLYCATLVASIAYWTFGVPALLVLSTVDGFLKHLSDAPGIYLVKDLLLGAVLAGMAIHVALGRDRYLNRRWYGFLPWALFFGYIGTQIAHPALGFSESLAGFRQRAFFSILYVVGGVYFARRERLIPTANLVVALGVLAAASGIVQHFMGSAWTHLGPGFARASAHYTSFSGDASLAPTAQMAARAYGTLVDPTAMGLFCTLGLLFAIAALGRVGGGGRVVLFICIAVMTGGLFESGTRSAMVGLAAGLFVAVTFMLTQRRMRAIAVIGLLLIGMVGSFAFFSARNALSERATSGASLNYAIGTRERSEAIVLGDLLQYPLGHGLGAAAAGGAVNPGESLAVDNVYLAYLYETGFIGLMLFLIVQLSFMALAARAACEQTQYQSVFIGFVATQCALLTASLATQGAFDYAPVGQIFWLFCGALALPWRRNDVFEGA